MSGFHTGNTTHRLLATEQLMFCLWRSLKANALRSKRFVQNSANFQQRLPNKSEENSALVRYQVKINNLALIPLPSGTYSYPRLERHLSSRSGIIMPYKKDIPCKLRIQN